MKDLDPTERLMNRHGPIAQAVEDMLPLHIMSIAIENLYQNGWEIRLDTREFLETAMINVMKRHTGQELVIAQKVEKASQDIIRLVSFDNARAVLLSTSFLIVKLVDEKLFLDATSQAVLTAMMIVADAQEDESPDFADVLEVSRQKAGQMLDECLRQGFYNHVVIPN